MSGEVVHFEIPADDPDRAAAFYSGAFGWNANSMPDMGYTLFSTGPTTEDGRPAAPGHINGGMMRRQEPYQHPIITIGVDDIDGALAKVSELGGSTVREKMDVGGMGFAAYFEDPEGNLIGLWQTAG
jgi:predicted enzyme related to lactoylglutathione lyase